MTAAFARYTPGVITPTAFPEKRTKGLLRAVLNEPPLRFVCRAACRVGLGSWEQRARFDALPYSQYAAGLQVACLYAELFDEREIAAVEFGVAGGNGLVALSQHAREIQRRTSIAVRVVGFDTGIGLPAVEDWRDAPWVYNPGDYPCDPASLQARLGGRAALVVGDIRHMFPKWIRSGVPPVGFISIDVDYYSSTAAILDALAACTPETLLPIASVYLDDIFCFGVPRCVGELAAIEEFNRNNATRQFDRADWFGEFRAYREALWLKRLFDLYCFDHPKMRCSRPRAIRRLDLAAD